jgi:hypothetical protein
MASVEGGSSMNVFMTAARCVRLALLAREILRGQFDFPRRYLQVL